MSHHLMEHRRPFVQQIEMKVVPLEMHQLAVDKVVNHLDIGYIGRSD